jgi:hypothetical protein
VPTEQRRAGRGKESKTAGVNSHGATR